MKCNKCGENKPLTDFYEDYRQKDGYNKICKKCIRKRQAEYNLKKESEKVKIIVNEGWSNTAIMCYERNCTCSDCFFEKFFSDKEQKCQMKFAVIDLVKKIGIPKEAEDGEEIY